MIRFAAVILVCLIPVVGSAAEEPGADDETGWTMTRLDLNVEVEEKDLSISVNGEMTLRLETERSAGPTLWLNTTSPGLQWVSLTGESVADPGIRHDQTASTARRSATVKLNTAAHRGDEITLRFSAEQIGESEVLISRPDFALASWVEGWYPIAAVKSRSNSALSEMMSVPGTTTFDLPSDWVAITDGRKVEREQRGDRTVEVWDSAERPVARSFTVGPHRTAEREVDGRMIRIHLIHEHLMSVDRLAELLAASMRAQEARFGPFPFSGYGVVEVPTGGRWNATSQQSFIMAKSGNFDHQDGKLQLWAHEMCHGWWGNTVGSTGFAAKMVAEALAQYGALVTIEALEGTDAMIDFLEFSRRNWSDRQCARGYFRLAEQGYDRPLSTIAFSGLSGNLSHNLVDSKGVWVYHMLRRKIGDDLFFGTLRDLIDEFAGRRLSLREIRDSFIAAAPGHDLGDFFAQWLDRTGAPRIEPSWSMTSDDHLRVVLVQTGDGEPFTLDLDVELVFEDGTTQQRTIPVSGSVTEVDWKAKAEPVDILIDPDRDHLLWRAAYETPPAVDGITLKETAPWLDPAVYEGTYRIELFSTDAEVFGDSDGLLFIKFDGDAKQLYPHVMHRFETYSVSVDFAVEDGRATGFTYEMSSGRVAEGVRID